MLYLLGERPVEVTATGFSFIEPGIDDVVLRQPAPSPSGIGANLHVSWIDPRKTRLMTVVGDEKMAIYNDVSRRPEAVDRRRRRRPQRATSASTSRSATSSGARAPATSSSRSIDDDRAAARRDRRRSARPAAPGEPLADRRRATASTSCGSSPPIDESAAQRRRPGRGWRGDPLDRASCATTPHRRRTCRSAPFCVVGVDGGAARRRCARRRARRCAATS